MRDKRLRGLICGLVWVAGSASAPGWTQTVPCGLAIQSAPSAQAASAARAVPGDWTDPANTLTFAFDASVPVADQLFIGDLWETVRPTLEAVIGPPTRNQTVIIDYGFISPQLAAAYWPSLNRIRLGWVPSIAGSEERFSENFVHEVVHAYQDAPLDTVGNFTDWVVEGLAVAATALVRLQHPTELNSINSLWDPEVITARYDSLAFMGPDRLSGTMRFLQTFDYRDAYTAAGGLWLILTGAHATGPVGDIAQYDFLRRWLAIHYAAQRPLDTTQVLTSLQQVLTGDIDGEPAHSWVERQPITETRGAAGNLLWAAGNPVGRNFKYGAFRRAYVGGPATVLTAGTMTDRLYDDRGNLVVERVDKLLTTYGSIGNSVNHPGSYMLEVDGTALGHGVLRVPVLIPPRDTPPPGPDGAVGLGFVHPALEHTVDVEVTPQNGQVSLHQAGLDVIRLDPQAVMPTTLAFDFGDGVQALSVPAPLGRNVPFKLRPGFEPDRDADGAFDYLDNCLAIANPTQSDYDGDGAGDACDACSADPLDDADGDGLCATLRADFDGDGCVGDADIPLLSASLGTHSVLTDINGSGTVDLSDVALFAQAMGTCQDNCPAITNPDQADYDQDAIGTACDTCAADPNNDADGDGVCAVIFGDVDGSGCVDALDLSLIFNALNSSDPVLDLDGDGLVTQTDLTLAAHSFGQCGDSSPAIPTGGTKPGPSMSQAPTP